MISFGIMSAVLAVMACVVHYDLLGWFPEYEKRTRATDDPRERHGPELEPASIWIPRPGTDPTVTSFLRPVTVVVEDYDSDDFWAVVEDYDSDDFWVVVEDMPDDRQSPGDDVVPSSYWSPKNDGGGSGDGHYGDGGDGHNGDGGDGHYGDGDDDDGDDDYVAPGEERDDDVF